MPALKRVLGNLSVRAAGKAAGCKFNQNHRVARGELRLMIKNPGPASGEHGYCTECGLRILAAAEDDLKRLRTELSEPSSD